MAPVATATKRPVTAPAAGKAAEAPAKPAAKAPAAPAAKKAVAAPVVEASVVVVPAEAAETSTVEKLTTKLTGLAAALKEAQALLKALAKEHAALLKLKEKVEKKKTAARSSPSGFAKPSKVTEELTDFMGLAKGTEVSRTEITRFITGYVRTHSLNDPADRRTINPDAKLKKLFKLGANDKISYFQLQRLITPFIIKA